MYRLDLRSRRLGQAGFTLIEALIALLVMAFGMLAIAGLQTTLSRSSDVAKQRSEAVRLAQVKMEELRSFDGLDAGTGAYTYTTNVVSNAVGDTISAGTNTTFTRTWNVLRSDGATPATGDDLEKWINVSVTWNDRTGQQQRVTLNSTIARNDPIALKGLIGGQARTKVRYPKSRNINIPYPAVTLSGGNASAFVPPPGNVVYVFDNDSGNILERCQVVPVVITQAQASTLTSVTLTAATSPAHPYSVGNRVAVSITGYPLLSGTFTVSAVSGDTFTYTLPTALVAVMGPTAVSGTAQVVFGGLVEGLDLTESGLTCTSYPTNAFLLSGYVRFKTSGTPSNADLENSTDQTLDLLASGPLTIADPGSVGNLPSTQVCYAQRQKVVSAVGLDSEQLISLVRGSTGIVTAITDRAHSFVPGMRIGIENVPVVAGGTNFNGSFVVLSVFLVDPGSKMKGITYAQDGAPATATLVAASSVSLIQQITIPESETPPTAYGGPVESRFVAYTCIVTPVDDNGDGTGGTPFAWWGELRLVPSGWTIGGTSSDYRVCRYTGDYVINGAVSNHEHPRVYRQVTGALDNQNFFVLQGDRPCPTDGPANPLATPTPDYVNTNTAPHQGGTGAPELSFQCSTADCTTKTVTESSTLTATVPMF